MTTAADDAPPPENPSTPQDAPSLEPRSADGEKPPYQRTERHLAIPTRTAPLLLLFTAAGAMVLAFAFFTVFHHGDPAELISNPGAKRANFMIQYWVDHGYFRNGGLQVRPGLEPGETFYYRSSTGGALVSGFIVQKIFATATGRTSPRLLAIHNQLVTLLAAALLALLAFRLVRRIGARPLHAVMLALAVQIVHFTFPDNLAVYWEISGRNWFLIFAVIFLLIEERSSEERTTRLTIAQGVAAFLLTYMEYVAGIAFLTSYAVSTLVLSDERPAVKRLAAVFALPMALALAVYAGQLRFVATEYGEVSTIGSGFLFRTGLDGSTQYYGDHLDIAFKRDGPRGNWAYNRPYLFRWKWLFLAGTGAFLSVLLYGIRGRVPLAALVALLSLLGTYVLYASVFSQAVMIHPYYYDVLLFTPLILALFAVLPSLFESMTEHRGVVVAAVLFLVVWVVMVQFRRYAMQYPSSPPKSAAVTAALG